MPLQIVRDNIVNVKADAIVNSANHEPIIGRGTDGAIYLAAGKDKLLAARKKIGVINFGDAKITDAFDLPVQFIIHTVAPIWNGGTSGEFGLLRACYKNSLNLAIENDCKSIAFPILATGINNFPHDAALKIAVNEIQNFLFDHEMFVVLAVFGKNIFDLSKKIFANVVEVTDDKFVASTELKEYSGGLNYLRGVQRLNIPDKNFDKNFREQLLSLIESRSVKNSEVYNVANVSAKVFSDIRTKENYQPSKKTAIAFALAIELPLDEAQNLLAAAGYTLSEAIELDAAIISCIRRKIFDIDAVNDELYKKNLPTF